MNYQVLKKYSLLRRLVLWIWGVDANNKYYRVQQYINKEDRLLDFGSGLGTVTKVLKDNGFEVVPLDIEDHSFYEETTPVLYDGEKTTFHEQQFDKVLMLTILHHVEDHRKLLREATRIGKKVIIIEDIYRNPFQKCLTFFFDSLVNLEFKGHPHSNRTDSGWRQLFEEMGFQVKVAESYRYMLLFRQVVYVIEKIH